jgi:hypothetical protein
MTTSQRPDLVIIEPPTPAPRQPVSWWKAAVPVAQTATGVFAGLAVIAIGLAEVLVFSR